MQRPVMRGVPLFSLVVVLLFAGAFWIRAGRRPPPSGTWAVPACDSASAASVVIDSLGRIDPFRSKVLRFERDSAGLRIVTIPDTPTIVDGMAVARVGARCRITSLVQTDSA
jgi:hypothetical protein